jgi:hypothetical protein
MAVVFGLLRLALLAILFRAFYFLDQLTRHEYRFYREAWERDGGPASWAFWPAESWPIISGIAFRRCALAWLFSSPEWTRNDPTAKALLSRMRWHVLVWNVGIVMFLLLLHFYRGTQTI